MEQQEKTHLLLARLANVQIKGERVMLEEEESKTTEQWQGWAVEMRDFFLSHQTLPDGIEKKLIQAEKELGLEY